MNNRWNDAAAAEAVERYGAMGINPDLALRTYTARLLGADETLVLHGGGNTSVKTVFHDLFGDPVDVLCVKGSGWDLATIEPAGHPAVRIAPLLRLRGLGSLSDEEMVNAQRQNLMDANAPNPSVETLLHAFIGAKFIDHTHAEPILALANQPGGEALVRDVLGPNVACVPYVMPGFALAKLAAEAWDRAPEMEAMVLLNHGVFSFGETAQQAYERMINVVRRAADFIATKRRRVSPQTAPSGWREALPILRGLLGVHEPRNHWILDVRTDGAAAEIAASGALADFARRGVATPDHVIRTKRFPLVLPAWSGEVDDWRGQTKSRLVGFVADYRTVFERQTQRVGPKAALDPLPRVAVLPGVGLIGIGRRSGAAGIAADIAGSWARTLLDAEAVGKYQPIGEADTFDMEYWSLEQAKLGKASEPPLAGRVVLVTGGASGIGQATAREFLRNGAEVAIFDRVGAVAAASNLGRSVLGVDCDVTDAIAVNLAFERLIERFGGVDIIVSNAGSAERGMIADMAGEVLRRSFELNFFAHQTVASAAVRVLRAQGTGGVLLFNISKQALNPGPDFGAYGTAKAALLALMRQYALEHGADGIRVNGVNADRIRSGLLTDEMIAARATARGLDEASYMAGNLLGAEVEAVDVAKAFVALASLAKTTGAVLTVDGGNVAAMVR
jgi:rhamnose utilization protein RhaD (predicted bifunctional aldolase and dehydrogenase)/NAD(P)-dependent dehydrogenase (short-subunit alcohol dehydrogenase family)